MLVVNHSRLSIIPISTLQCVFSWPKHYFCCIKISELDEHFDDTTFKGTDAQLKRKETEKLNEQSRETLGRRLIFLNPALLG